ncbi:glycosyltransferase family 8 protein [Viridothelium virens]|uniref:Glycosyltransferase family 8 protein n=1 Tax=Viridothelium virens TaxID=1048519 RepID=A0A6A6H177_VIRVR|nr:glycosyltransferase family 8 protein [Viridothelium virens]
MAEPRLNGAVSQVNPEQTRVVDSKKVWATLITNTKYLTGLLCLDYSLKRTESAYPLVALYTDSFPPEGHRALDDRGIPKKRVNFLQPSEDRDLSGDPRFHATWSKLTLFSLVEYERVVLLDSDMVVRGNMDELMDLELDPVEMGGKGNRVFAASHACACNPFNRPHYPKTWVPENCAFTAQHNDPETAQRIGAPCTAGVGMLNSGLIVAIPSAAIYTACLKQLESPATEEYKFPDQALLSDVYNGRWVALPYIYNALKTLRMPGVHDKIWRDDSVKVVHYILDPKPWNEQKGQESDITNKWWWDVNEPRLQDEQKKDIHDGW